MACAIADDMLNPTSISDKKAKDEISSKLRHWSKYFVGLQLKDRDILILHIVTTPDIVKTYLTFADSLFSGMLQAKVCEVVSSDSAVAFFVVCRDSILCSG